jgi:uncharacterized protein (DUF1499 family)
VSSQAPRTDLRHRIEPLPFAAPTAAVLHAVLVVLARTPRLRVLERDSMSVHAVARSRLLRIPLDLEVIIEGAVEGTDGLLHLRASTPFALRERTQGRTRARELLALIDRELRSSA